MSDHTTYPLDEALKALQALRAAAFLPPEQFPMQAFVGMISDEIDALRKQGKSDADIASMIQASSFIRIDAETIAEHYATPEERHAHR